MERLRVDLLPIQSVQSDKTNVSERFHGTEREREGGGREKIQPTVEATGQLAKKLGRHE